mmetsp:Transcript_15365/g.43918  ORF Transcript_15365/g.43918 Transcript_15365/m.43918 type:complete len:211 (+) Transcript_15365:189-821(+)
MSQKLPCLGIFVVLHGTTSNCGYLRARTLHLEVRSHCEPCGRTDKAAVLRASGRIMIEAEVALIEHATVVQDEQPRLCLVEGQLGAQDSRLLAPCIDRGLPIGVDIWDPEMRKAPQVIEILRHHTHHNVAHRLGSGSRRDLRDRLLDVCGNKVFDGWIRPCITRILWRQILERAGQRRCGRAEPWRRGRVPFRGALPGRCGVELENVNRR